MDLYEKYKFEWLTAFLSRKRLPEINDLLKFNQHPERYSRNKQAWLWVYEKFRNDKEIKKKLKTEKNIKCVESFLERTYSGHFHSP